MWTRKASLSVLIGSALVAAGLAAGSAAVVATGLVLLGFVLVNRLLFRDSDELRAHRHVELERIFEGDTLDVRLRVENPGSRLLFVEVRDRLPRQLAVESGSPYDFLALPKNGRTDLEYSVRAPLLGVYSVGPTDLRLEDPFGFFYDEREVEGDNVAWVLPRIEDLRKAALISNLPLPILGEHQVNRPGDGFDFFALREYAAGDTMRMVNWKASARSGKMMVNQMERTTAAEIVIFVDGRAVLDVGPEIASPRVLVARAAASLTDFAYKTKDTARVIIYNDHVREIEPMPQERMIPFILEAMAELHPTGDLPLRLAVSDVLPSLKRMTPVVIVSPLLDDDSIREAASILLANDMILTVVSPDPGTLPGVDPAFARALLDEREMNLRALRAYGAMVVTLDAETPLAAALEKGAMVS